MSKKAEKKEADHQRVEQFWKDMEDLLAVGLINTSSVAARLAGVAARYQIEHGAKAAGQMVMEKIAEAMKGRG